MMLTVCAALYGAIAALVFRRFADGARVRVLVNRILAHVMEFALFIDEPRIVLKAQLDLLKDNFRLLRRIALPCVLMAIPLAFLYPAMDRRFGDQTSRVLTLPMGQPLPSGVVLETPGVRVLRTHEVSWRVKPAPGPRTNPFGLHWTMWFAAISSLTALLTYFPAGGKVIVESASNLR